MALAWHPIAVKIGGWQHSAVQALLLAYGRGRRMMLQVGDITTPAVRMGKGPPLVVVHGFGDSHVSFVPLAVGLARHFEVIAFDLPGFGAASPVPTLQTTVRQQAAFLAEVLDQLGLGSVHLLGHSMGGSIVARFGHDFGARVQSLTLLSPAGPKGLCEPLQSAWRAGEAPLAPKNFAEFEVVQQLCVQKPMYIPGPMLRYAGEVWCQRQPEMAAHFGTLMAPPPGDEVPADLRPPPAPVTVVWGERELLVHPDNLAFYIERLAPIVVHLPGVGHAGHLEAPGEVVRAVVANAQRAN